jgi:hypothetical protein
VSGSCPIVGLAAQKEKEYVMPVDDDEYADLLDQCVSEQRQERQQQEE